MRAKLAACATFFPATSLFFWKGKLCREKEYVLELKCAERNYGKMERKLRVLHSYSLPQVVAFKVARASREYKKWVDGK